MNNKLKKGMVSLLTVGTLLLPSATAFAADSQTINGGIQVISATAKTGLSAGNVAGGHWIRGRDGSYVVSKYKHFTKDGRASVTSGAGHYVNGGWKAKNIYSNAQTTWTTIGTNKANYDYR